MPLYLGKPGTALTSIRPPKPQMDRSPSAGEGVHDLLAGGSAVDRRPSVARTWQMEWGWDNTVWWQLYGFYTGQSGFGPYAMYEPAAINLLTPNQAAGTEPFKDSSGFSVDASESLASSTTAAYQGTKSLRWTLPASVTSGILTLSAPAGLTAWPTPAGAAWTLSGYCLSAGTDSTFDARLALRWLDSSGATLSTTSGTYTAMSSSSWTRLTLTGSAPAGAVYFTPLGQVDPTDISAAAVLCVDAMQLQLGATATAWRPGEGPPLVSMNRLREVVGLATSASEQRRTIQCQFTQLRTAA